MKINEAIEKHEKELFLIYFLFISLYQVSLQIHLNSSSLFGHINDDAYISLTYAKNFWSGNGLTYNTDSFVEGYTNFLWIIIMTIPFYLGIDPVFFIKCIGSISSITLIFFIYLISRKFLSPLPSTLLSAALGANSHIAYMASWGLETIFFLTIYLSSIYSLINKRYYLSGLLFAFSAMTRMDSIIIFIVFWVFTLLKSFINKDYSDLTKLTTSFLIVFGLYFLWRFSYYGFFLPNTYYAKIGGGEVKLDVLLRGVSYLTNNLESLGIFLITLFGLFFCFISWAIYSLLYRCFDCNDHAYPVIISAILYLSYIVFVGGDCFKERFIFHALPLIIIGSSAAVYRLSTMNGSLNFKGINLFLIITPALYFISLCTSKPTFTKSTHLLSWVALGKHLENITEPGTSVATCAAGAIKYYSQLDVIDILGLNDSHIAHRKVPMGTGEPGHEKQDNKYVLNKHPTFISTWIDPDGGAGRSFKNWFLFRTNYKPYAIIKTSSTTDNDELIQLLPDGISQCLLANYANINQLNGYDWGVWKRNNSNIDFITLLPSDFFSHIPGSLGQCNSSYIANITRSDPTGHFMFGPYMAFPEGTFRVNIHGSISDCYDHTSDALIIDVYDGNLIHDKKYIKKSDKNQNNDFISELFFTNSAPSSENKFQFRAESLGLCNITISSVTVKMLSPESVAS